MLMSRFNLFRYDLCYVFFLMIRRPPRSTRTDTLFPYTTRFRSTVRQCIGGKEPGKIDCPDSAVQEPIADLHGYRYDWIATAAGVYAAAATRSEEHTSELQSLMRISYAVFCLKKKIRI